MSQLKIFVLTLFLISSSAIQSSELTPSHVDTVKQFVAAFNAHDSNAMAKFVSDDIEWLSINGKQVVVEAKGKSNLIKSMNAYFESCSTCRSKLSNAVFTGSRVSAVETASWQGKSGLKSQKTISVYEFSEGMIVRVYYFPAEQ